MIKWILKEKYDTLWKIQYKDWIDGKVFFNTFFSFQKTKRKNAQKESNLAESTAIADATRFIVTLGRAPLWKSRGTAITRKDYVLLRNGRINHSSTDNLTGKSVKVLDSICLKKYACKNCNTNTSNLKNKTLVFNRNYHISSKTIYVFCK